MSIEREKSKEQISTEKLVSLKKELIFLNSRTEGSSGDIDEYSYYADRLGRVRQEVSNLESGLPEEQKKSIDKEVQVDQLKGLIRVMKQTGWSDEEINAQIQILEQLQNQQ